MSPRFEAAFSVLLKHEGGFVNHPRDPGGATKFGISKKAHPDVDVSSLTLDDAKAIYWREYWQRLRCDELPPGLALLVFDAGVNNGVGRAARWLQEAAGVVQDGRVGPITVAAARKLGVARRFHERREAFMRGLETFDVFGRGWAERLAALPFEAIEIAEAAR